MESLVLANLEFFFRLSDADDLIVGCVEIV